MINYNPKHWFTFIFQFQRSDTFHKLLPLMIGIALFTAAVCWLEIDFFKLEEDHFLKNISVMHSMLTFVISMLLVFRTNSAYERWWEGRKLWGSLVNNSRNLALKISTMYAKDTFSDERKFYGSMISNYAYVLKNHLRNSPGTEELHENNGFKFGELQHYYHHPNFIAKRVYAQTIELQNRGLLTQEQLLFLNPELISFTDICGACERIKNTPIPLSYSIFIKKFIFYYIMSLPFTLAFSLGYYSVPAVVFIFYVLSSLELIAEEIEDPFGKDDNDLPMDAMCKNIRRSVYEILELESK